jgi:hypothetical protein
MSSHKPLILVAVVRPPVSPDLTGPIRRTIPQVTVCEYLNIVMIPVSKWKEAVVDYLDFVSGLEKSLRVLWAGNDMSNDYPNEMVIGLYQVH